jgi:acetyl-CoA acetyltransferase
MRYQQYQEALKDDAAFLKRFMVWPVEVKAAGGRKVIGTVTGDEGVFPTTADGLAKLKPAMEGGTVTFGTQTYPADGNAGVMVTDRDKAAELSRDSKIVVRVVSFGQGRAEKGLMAMANVPAARQALDRADLAIGDIKAIKTHNPFAVNDVYFAREMEVQISAMNRFGSSLVWGHPQAPTGARLIMELIEELVLAGGGYGLFTGCAAGDTALALILKVD